MTRRRVDGFDPAPLIAAAALDARAAGKDPVDAEVAYRVGVDRRSVVRWRNEGARIPWDLADVYAARLYRHPWQIWGEDWWGLDLVTAEAELAAEAELEEWLAQ